MILFTLVLLMLIVAGSTSFLLLTAVHARQSGYERNAIQALYAAEAGVDVALAAAARGETPETLSGECGDGRWSAGIRHDRGRVAVTSVGHVEPTVGATVARKVLVEARREGGHWRVLRWQRLPISASETPGRKPSPALNEGIGEE